MNRIIDSEWLMIAARWLVVDLSSSTNSTTRAPINSRSPWLTTQAPCEAALTVNSGAESRPAVSRL